MIYLFETRKILDFYAAKVVQAYQAELKKNRKFASGGSSKSVQSTVTVSPIFAGFEVVGDKVFDYIEFGRRAGAKMPPKGSIDTWLQIKGIPEKFDFIIRRNIGIKGIAPTPISANIKQSLLPKMTQELTTAFGKDIQASFLQQAEKIF